MEEIERNEFFVKLPEKKPITKRWLVQEYDDLTIVSRHNGELADVMYFFSKDGTVRIKEIDW